MKKIKAVILAGGKGTRLYPITKETPKPLLCIKKKPIINYLVDLFLSQKIKDIAVLINKDFKEDFIWWNKRYYPKNKIKIFEEKESLGTFGGLSLLKKWLDKDPFFLTNGDELKKIDLVKMATFHKKNKKIATIALAKVENPQDYGVVLCNAGVVSDFIEKPKNPLSKYINSGLYLLQPEIFQYHQGLKFSMIEKDVFPILAKQGNLAGFKFEGKWMDCGTWDRYSNAIENWE